ncbi:MAG: DUF3365 domain-containing protein [Saprospiraceae bacterium]
MKNKALSVFFFLLLAFFFWDCKNTTPQEKEELAIKAEQEAIYLSKGKQIAASTFIALSQQLQKAVKEGGIPNAIQYCNLAAYPITDSLSQVHQAVTRRTSLRNRNPKNKATEIERIVLEDFEKRAAEGQSLKPVVKFLDEQKVAFYAPIKLNDFCLNCHGKLGETLTDENYTFIKKYYPEDKAIGYLSGDLRGMWSIQLTK